jgi:hypothetical protein
LWDSDQAKVICVLLVIKSHDPLGFVSAVVAKTYLTASLLYFAHANSSSLSKILPWPWWDGDLERPSWRLFCGDFNDD